MRTVTFQNVLWGVARLAGLDPRSGDLDSRTAGALTEFINDAVRRCWEHAFWPELVRVERRQYRASWAAGTSYAAGDEVWEPTGDRYYVAVQASTGEDPAGDDGTYWTAVGGDFDPYVGYVQDWEGTVIDAVESVSARPPYGARAGTLPFRLSWNGVQVYPRSGDSGVPTRVWVAFREPPPIFEAEEWDAGEAYVAWDRVFYGATGECYLALKENTGTAPPADAEAWRKIDFPRLLEPAVRRFAYADWLRDDGQNEKAMAEQGVAEDRLADLELSAFEQQEQVPGSAMMRG